MGTASSETTSQQTRESRQFSWVNSQVLKPQDKENSCWKVGVRWLIGWGTIECLREWASFPNWGLGSL